MDRVESRSETGSHARVGESVVDRVCEEHEVESLKIPGRLAIFGWSFGGQPLSLCSSPSLALIWCSV